jgi:hypothetical protein
MEFLNTTKLSFDELVNLLSKRVSNKKKMIISAISSLILLAIIILSWDSNMLAAYIMMSCLVGSGFILSILVILLDKFMVRKSNMSFASGVTYEYRFREKDFTVTSIVKNEKKSITFTYSSLSKVVINEDNIYLYPTAVSVYCVNLLGFENEEERNEVIHLLTPFQKKGKR